VLFLPGLLWLRIASHIARFQSVCYRSWKSLTFIEPFMIPSTFVFVRIVEKS
jgi:hypothetical protein